MRQRLRLKQEEADRLDFHGLGGDIEGLRAFLSHKYGGSIRGWRKAIAPDAGVANVLRSDFCLGLKRIGYTGHLKSLWEALVKRAGGAPVLGIEHFEPDLAQQLDVLTKRLGDRFGGGSVEAWSNLQHAHLARANFSEFEQFAAAHKLVPRNVEVQLRRVFEALDMNGLGTLTREDFRFFDHWSLRRFGVPLPEAQDEETRWQDEEHWFPPHRPPTPELTLDDFRIFLVQKYGTPGRAWRVALDLRGVGALSSSEFGKGCRCVGWKPSHHHIFKELAPKGGGLATMRGLDPGTSDAIDKLNMAISEKYEGDMHEFWVQVLDPDGTGMVPRSDFVNEVAEEADITMEQAKFLFQVLDTSNTGYIAEAELTFVEVFESQLAVMRRQQQRRVEAPASMFHSASSPVLSTSSSGFYATASVSLLGSGSEKAHPHSPLKSTRLVQARALANTQRIKQKFLVDNLKHHWSIKSVQLAEDMRHAKAAAMLSKAGEDEIEEDGDEDDADEDEDVADDDVGVDY